MSGLTLGQHTTYPEQYDAGLLYAVPRIFQNGTDEHGNQAHWQAGRDFWRAYEASWLDETGKPQTAVLDISYPASSPFIVESKSLKLYLNSLNFERYPSTRHVLALITADLESIVKTPVMVSIAFPRNFDTLPGICLDSLGLPNQHTPAHDPARGVVSEHLFSHLFRSTCPVTAQPDWATVLLRYQGHAWNHARILDFLVSYRRHNGFHESCAEQLFNRLWEELQPQQLMVYASFTRRGGIDINPCRSSTPEWVLSEPLRLYRQ